MNKDEEQIMELDMDPESPKDQAFVWLTKLATGEADARMLGEFEAWRDSDPRNQQALSQARALWLMFGKPLEQRYAPAMESMAIPHHVATRSARFRRPMLAAAAIFALAVGIGQWLSVWRFDQATATGEQRTLALQDGSTMWLNTGSAADIRVGKSERRVWLARGEAYFDVAHDRTRPFIVEAGIGRIKVIGTAFAVMRDGDDVVVTVQRGKVQVSGGGSAPLLVTPDQQVRVHAGDRVKRVELLDAEQRLSWRTGRLVFENRPISEILNELKRYDSRVVLVRYPDASKVRVSSIIDLARLDEWYDTMEQSLPVDVSRFGPVVWISANGTAAKI